MAEVIVVVPNHLPHLDFLKEWEELKGVEIIVVQDIGAKPDVPEGYHVTIYDHKDVEADLGKNAWIIPTASSACRSYGYYKAWRRGATHILTLDNDCYPTDDDSWLQDHFWHLGRQVTLDWVNSGDGLFYRGFPYAIRKQAPVYLSHGLWSNIPDLDAPTSLHHPDARRTTLAGDLVIPRHNFFPMCGMNLAWRAELTPAMYFGLFGPDYGFDQYDDIWAGVVVKKVLDHLGFAARSGYPSVEHRKQSNVFTNLKKQAPGMAMNEVFWQVVRDIKLTKDNITDCYEELIQQLPDEMVDDVPGWLPKFKEAALIWLNLFR